MRMQTTKKSLVDKIYVEHKEDTNASSHNQIHDFHTDSHVCNVSIRLHIHVVPSFGYRRKYAYKLGRLSEPPQSITLPKLLKIRSSEFRMFK
ncbi:hypothetical protein MTR_1g058590 [Medicago truncatula]|uniref:Uncharacterized protein n=1 Tax=Medicago truncatula TaxID=3880 RepID=A0A072VIY4_MEDTR|nr:hypothetical protein MTR_1g058590 [Medicago truncatula]